MLVLVGLTIAAGVGLVQLTIDASSEHLFLRHSDAYQTYQRFLTTFGRDETILVALHDPVQSLLTPAGLTAIRTLTQALTALPQVASVISLTNAQDMSRLTITPFGLTAPHLLASDEITPEQLTALRRNDLVIGTLLSADLQTAGLLVIPKDTIAAPLIRKAWIAAVRTVAAQHAIQKRQTYVAGSPLERDAVTMYLQRDQEVIIPLVFLILLGITYGIYQIKRFAVIPLLCVLLSLLWTMGMVGFVHIPLNLVTALLPPVVMVVSVSAAIHVLNQYIDAIKAGVQGTAAVEYAMHQVGAACFLTSLTTAMGFFSLLVSPIPAIQEFALFTGVGVLIAFLVTLTVVPLALLHLGHITPERLTPGRQSYTERLLDRLMQWVLDHHRQVFVWALLILLISLPGIVRLREGTDMVRALKPGAPLRISTEFIDQHLGGVNSLELMVQLPDAGGNTDPNVIRQVLALSAWLRMQAGVTSVYSPWEFLRQSNPDLATSEAQLSVMAALLPFAAPLQRWLDTETHTLRLSARVRAMSSDQFLELAEHVERQTAQMHLPVEVTGSTYLLAQMSRSLVQTQIRSLLLAALLILGVIGLFLGTWQLGLIAAVPNVLPPLMIFGLMGWCGIALSTATTMIASVALGLIVDNTIHLLYRYRHEKKTAQTISQALIHTVHHTGRAVIFSAIILTLGFWAGVLGSFKPTIYFSFLTGLTMIFALLADVLLLPATLIAWERGWQGIERSEGP